MYRVMFASYRSAIVLCNELNLNRNEMEQHIHSQPQWYQFKWIVLMTADKMAYHVVDLTTSLFCSSHFHQNIYIQHITTQ